jgi:hypothetical protein
MDVRMEKSDLTETEIGEAGEDHVRFEVFTAATMKIIVSRI